MDMLDANDEPWDMTDDVCALSLVLNVVLLALLIGAVIALIFWRKVV